MELSKKSENVQHRNWYQKNKRNPGFLERQRAYSKKSRDSRKDDPEYKQNRRQYDSAYRIGRIEQDSNYLMREREKKYIYLSRQGVATGVLEGMEKEPPGTTQGSLYSHLCNQNWKNPTSRSMYEMRHRATANTRWTKRTTCAPRRLFQTS